MNKTILTVVATKMMVESNAAKIKNDWTHGSPWGVNQSGGGGGGGGGGQGWTAGEA